MPVKYLEEVIVSAVAKYDRTRSVDSMSKKYQINLTQLSDEEAEKLRSLGLNVRDDSKDPKDGLFVIPKNGMYPPEVVDNDGNPMPPEIRIGNGSKVRVLLTPYEYDAPHGQGVACGIGGVRVVELQEYSGGGGVEKLFEENGDNPF